MSGSYHCAYNCAYFMFVHREQMLEALLEVSRHLLVPEMSQNKAGTLARQVAGSLLQVGFKTTTFFLDRQ